MPIAPLAAMGTIVFTLINFLKSLTNKDFSGAITQAVSWLAGIIVIVLAAKTDYASSIKFGDIALDNARLGTQVFLGLIASSILGAFVEAKKALDTSDTAKQPPLIPQLDKEV